MTVTLSLTWVFMNSYLKQSKARIICNKACIHAVFLKVMITHPRVNNGKQDNIPFYFVQPFESHMYMFHSSKKKMVYESKCRLKKVMKQFQKYATLTFYFWYGCEDICIPR